MENKVIKFVCVILAVLLLIGMGVCVYCLTMGSTNAIDVIEVIDLALTAAFAIYYILAGAKKGEGTSYFRWFVSLLAIAEIIPLLNHETMTIASVIALAIAFGCLTVLYVGRNLGKTKSLLLSLAVIAMSVIDLLCSLQLSSIIIIMIVIHILLAVSLFVMVLAKYADKKTRGSK